MTVGYGFDLDLIVIEDDGIERREIGLLTRGTRRLWRRIGVVGRVMLDLRLRREVLEGRRTGGLILGFVLVWSLSLSLSSFLVFWSCGLMVETESLMDEIDHTI